LKQARAGEALLFCPSVFPILICLFDGAIISTFCFSPFASIYNKSIFETNVDQNIGSLVAAAVAAVGSGLWPDYDQARLIHTRLDAIDLGPQT